VPLTLDDLVRLPLPGSDAPTQFRFGPGGVVTFAAPRPGTPTAGSPVQVLWALDPATGERRVLVDPAERGVDEASLPLEERLRRERLRERAVGVTTWSWSKRGETLVVPLAGEIWAQAGREGALRRLVGPGAIDPRLSPDGTRVGFVRNAELAVVDVATGEVTEVTTGARGTGRTHGLAEYVAQEEMHRHEGFWWSPDSARLAYAEVDETHIPVWRIPYEGKDVPSWEDHRYPFAGQANAKVSLWVVSAGGGAPVRMQLAEVVPDHEYLAWVRWMPDGTLVAALQDRRQQQLTLARFDASTGVGAVLLEERSAVWINLHDGFRPLPDGGFLWLTEESGFQHLVQVSATGERRVLTSGPWVVEAVAGVSTELGVAWVVGNRESPLERHLYEVPLDGGEPVRRTASPGYHVVVVDSARGRFVDHASTRSQPPTVSLRDRSGALLHVLHAPADPRAAAMHVPELRTFVQRDGVTLYGALWKPDVAGPWPLVVIVYGGPHVQRVADKWETTIDLRAQYLRERGVAVLKVDNRGSSRRGLAFEAALRHCTGHCEVADQADAVGQLVAEGLVDPARVGMTGWSYGGYLTAMALCLAPDVFRVGVAGAPVTHWDGYDTHYTERYMGLPAENEAGYTDSSVMAHVAGLRSGALMLVHGMLDENVHFRHTARLINALLHHRKDYQLELFPDERHLPRKPADRRYMEDRILRFLQQGLGVQ
jgi:dipeptidyl-peptidase-4